MQTTRTVGQFRLHVLLIAFLQIALFALPAWSKSDESKADETAPKYVSVPVFYVTDRVKNGEGFGSHRRYAERCLHQMYYGTAFVDVPNKDQKLPSGKEFASLGWKGSDQKPAKVAPKQMIESEDYAASQAEFFQRIKTAMAKSEQSELCVFVHGACDAFEDCAQDAATMAYYMQKPVVLYSWPSNPKWRSYFVDGVNNEWSQGHFNMFCKDLIDLKEKSPFKVIFVSHSMGNRLVVRSLPVSYGKDLVSEWNIVSADIDADTCRHYLMGLTQDQSRIRLYVSNKDKMLPLSQMLSGGYYRTGEAANQVVVPKNWKPTDKSQMERIDFTAIDTGLHGHSIPFDLISTISKDGQLPQGLKLVPESEVKVNRLVRMANRSEKLSDTTGGLPNQYCKRVVKIKEAKTKK